MVEYALNIDTVFHSLADPIRRDILERARDFELTVNEIAEEYDVSLAAISKHLKILLQANLITKRRQGKYFMVRTKTESLSEAEQYLAQYRNRQQSRYDALEQLVNERN